MEEFKHMIVEDFSEEEFYETIEAPKFVDLTAPDHRPEGDDRYWFCSRVGCEQKHEEFLDSEVIYKNFVLRVMAARSPNVRLRKALYRKDSSIDPKCPNTVPAKPSRSRISRLAMISSIPQKANEKIRSKEVSTNKNGTPKTKVKGKDSSSVISSVPQKALTERKKQLQSPAGFRSPRTATISSENRVVAKALVFKSPKKLVKLKRSVELRSSVKKLCNGRKKLETEMGVDHKALVFKSPKKLVKLKRSVELRSSVKKLCNGRKKLETEIGVDHKVGASVPYKRPLKGREVKSRVFDSVRLQKQKAKSPGTVKQRVQEKEEHLLSSEHSKAHGMEVENQSLCCESSLPKSDKTNGDKEFLVQKKSEESLDTVKTILDNHLQDREGPDVIKNIEVDKENQYQITEIEDKENAVALECEDKENATNAADFRENDDKENSSALDNNRKTDQATYPLLKKKVFVKKENCKPSQKVMTEADKCLNGKTGLASTRVKYTKPKLTNPKPFRLRTDERRILKEANTEKKPQDETASILGIHGLGPKHQPVRLENNRLKASTLVSENMNCKRVALGGRKKQVASKGIETVEETKKVATIKRPSVCVVGSGEKRSATVPKGPHFHSIHVPKSCTKRLASQI